MEKKVQLKLRYDYLDDNTHLCNKLECDHYEIENVVKILKKNVPTQLHADIAAIAKRKRIFINTCNNIDDVYNETYIKKLNVVVIIAEVMKDVWSNDMLLYVENIILNKACEEGQYFEWNRQCEVKVFDEKIAVERNDNDASVMEIVNLVWNVLNVKKEFDHIKNHRYWINQSYDRLKNFLPQLTPKIVARHDLSKYAFSQAIGYTLRWVWGIKNHPIWIRARYLHLFNEPHHPENWTISLSPEEKQKKMIAWMSAGKDTNNENDIKILQNHNYVTTDFPLEFLLESLIDMVAVDWERKKGGKLSLSNKDLVHFDKNPLNRYNIKQRNQVAELIEYIIKTESKK